MFKFKIPKFKKRKYNLNVIRCHSSIFKNLCTKIDYTNNKITDFTDIKLVYNTMNNCFNKKTPCLLSDDSLSNVTLDSEITIVYSGLAYIYHGNYYLLLMISLKKNTLLKTSIH